MIKPTTAEVACFFDKVRITKHCWLWLAPLNSKGYGQFRYDNRRIQAHRFSYGLFVRPIEDGKMILHRRECGNRNCVNPHHLYMGTNADNMRDMMLWGNATNGENNGYAKLSESDVLNIRRIHKNKRYGYAKSAQLFGVSPTAIGLIVRRLRWKHI